MPHQWTYFKAEEVEGLNEEFVSQLDMAAAKTIEISQEHQRVVFFITSGFRSPEKNQSVIGAVPDSSHCKGFAVDLRVENDHEAWLMIAALKTVGITRIGVYVNKDWKITHLHCDADPDKVQQVMWIKQEGQPNSVIATA